MNSSLHFRQSDWLNSCLGEKDYVTEKIRWGYINTVWMWELDCKESSAPKNWCFWTVMLEKTLESPLDCKEIQPVHPKEISPGCSLEGLMLKLELQYFGYLMRRAYLFEKTLMLGKIEGRRRRGRQRMRWLDGITNTMDMGLGRLWQLVMAGMPGVLRFMGSQRLGHDWTTELNWYKHLCLAQDFIYGKHSTRTQWNGYFSW